MDECIIVRDYKEKVMETMCSSKPYITNHAIA
jgi:hypothetical protein